MKLDVVSLVAEEDGEDLQYLQLEGETDQDHVQLCQMAAGLSAAGKPYMIGGEPSDNSDELPIPLIIYIPLDGSSDETEEELTIDNDDTLNLL